MGANLNAKELAISYKWKTLIFPTIMLFVAGAAYGGITSANKLAMSADFPFVAITSYNFLQTF